MPVESDSCNKPITRERLCKALKNVYTTAVNGSLDSPTEGGYRSEYRKGRSEAMQDIVTAIEQYLLPTDSDTK